MTQEKLDKEKETSKPPEAGATGAAATAATAAAAQIDAPPPGRDEPNINEDYLTQVTYSPSYFVSSDCTDVILIGQRNLTLWQYLLVV